jgi:hypothetical protein
MLLVFKYLIGFFFDLPKVAEYVILKYVNNGARMPPIGDFLKAKGGNGSAPDIFENLVVLNFPDHNNSIPGEPHWHQNVFTAHTCSRHLMVMSKQEWEKSVPKSIREHCFTEAQAKMERRKRGTDDLFDDPKQKAYHVEFGEEAYKLLLTIAVGLKSKHKLEDQVHGQIGTQWRDYSTRQFAKSRELEKYMGMLIHDSRTIHSAIIKAHTMPEPYSVAKQLAHAGKNDAVVIFAADKLEEITDMSHVLGKQSNNSVDEVFIIHPDEAKIKRIQENLDKMYKLHQMKSNSSAIPLTEEWKSTLEDIALPGSKAVFVLQTLGQNAAYDREIMRLTDMAMASNPKSKVVLMHRPSSAYNGFKAVGDWLEKMQKSDRLVTIDTVTKTVDAQQAGFKVLMDQTVNGVENCIASHKLNRHPIGAILALPTAQYVTEMGHFGRGAAPKPKPPTDTAWQDASRQDNSGHSAGRAD